MCWWCLCSMPVSWVVAFPATCGLHLFPVVLGTYPEMHLMDDTVIPHHHPFTAVVPFYIFPEVTHFSCFGVVVTVIKWYTIVVLVCTSLMTSDVVLYWTFLPWKMWMAKHFTQCNSWLFVVFRASLYILGINLLSNIWFPYFGLPLDIATDVLW